MKNILLIGDSISLDYGKYLDDYTAADIHIYGKPGRDSAYENLDIPIGGNGGDSSNILNWIKSEESTPYLNCEYFFFNAGLHDIKHYRDKVDFQIPISQYMDNLGEIITLMNSRGCRVVFINTTPTDTLRYPDNFEFVRYTDDVLLYNSAADTVALKYNIPIVDLYSFTMSLGLNGDDLYRDHTHFQPEVIRLQAAYLAGEINSYVRFCETQ